MDFASLAPYFANEDKAIEFVESLVWPDGPICPHCGGLEKAYRIKGKSARPGLLKCGYCRNQFTVKIGTIFEGSHIPLTKWLIAIYLMCSAKKGISANQLKRTLNISYKSAWFLCHRVREAMKLPPLVGKLGSEGTSGIVEVDETYVGGKRKNKLKKQFKGGRGPLDKIQVSTLVERDGDVRSFMMPSTEKGHLHALVRLNVEETAHIMTDEHASYVGLEKHFASHGSVKHSKKEYVRGIIHTNFAESYHSLLKRSIFGAYHHISAKHLPRYLREREFHWNRRHATDGERTADAIRGAKGKRLMYRHPI